MFSRIKGQKGFTLIELMIVVAIIGILAAIAIPNFLQYQMKARQTEAKTNTMGIKTSMVSYSGSAGCFPGIAGLPVAAPTSARQAWGAPVPFVPTALLCDPLGAIFTGAFGDIGFVPTGNVYYQYVVASVPLAATAPLRPTIAAAAGNNGCVAIAAIPAPGGALGNAGFQAVALGNLDGDVNFSNFSSDDATGATDCTPGIY